MTLPESLFWIAVAILLYSYGGFSVLLMIAGKLLNRRTTKKNIKPAVSVIIAAYNEEQGIASKLENVLSLDYPSDLLEVIVASDGSDDSTATIVSDFELRGVRFLNLPRRGKLFALDDAVKEAHGQVLVFSDANTLFHPQAIRHLVRNFADPRVGGVCGNQQHISLESGDNSSKGEQLYWAYDKWLKNMENRTGSIVSADGAIYAIRRELYRMPGRTDVTDDFAISTAIIEQGYRLVFESDALAHEQTSATAHNEFSRKVRIMNRGLRGVLMRRKLLNPFRFGFYSVILFSHKVLRRLVPLILVWLFVTSWVLADVHVFYLAASVAQTIFYALAFTGFLLRRKRLGRSKFLYIPFFYCLANMAALIAIMRLLRGKRIELWQPQRDRVERQKLVNGEVA